MLNSHSSLMSAMSINLTTESEQISQMDLAKSMKTKSHQKLHKKNYFM